MGLVMAVVIAVGVLAAYHGTRHAPVGTVTPGAGTLLDQLRLVAGARDLLAASGLVGDGDGGGLALPERMAEVNVPLDLAAPAMREALMVSFLDRLSRPAVVGY